MASDLNTRLSAILERQPQLALSDDGKYRRVFSDDTWWCVRVDDEDGEVVGAYDEEEARALIFKAMVEQLPWPYELGRLDPGADAEWFITSGTSGVALAISDTALDALCAYYEGAAHEG